MHHYADWRIQILFPKGLKKCTLCSLFKNFYINVLISDNFFSVHSLSGVQDPKAAPRSRAWLPWQGEEGPGQGHCWPPGSSDRRYSIGEYCVRHFCVSKHHSIPALRQNNVCGCVCACSMCMHRACSNQLQLVKYWFQKNTENFFVPGNVYWFHF